MIRLTLVYKFMCFFWVASLCAGVYGQGSDTMEFFKSDVPVQNQSPKERQFAAQKGLQEVVVRMSGTDALNDPNIQRAISKAQSFVLQFQYKQLTDEKLLEEGYQQTLSLVFSPRLVEQLIRNTKNAYWPVKRPKTLVWIVEDDAQSGRRFLGESDEHEFIKSIKKWAVKRGTPIFFPLLDMDDQLIVSVDDLWSLKSDAVLEASEKYGADVILAGRFSQTSSGNTIATWQMFHDGQQRTFDLAEPNHDELAEQVVSNLAGWLSNMYSIVQSATEQQQWYVQIFDIDNFKEYVNAISYMKGLALAKSATLAQVNSDSIIVSLQSDVELNRLVSTLRLNRKVKKIETKNSATPTITWPGSAGQNPFDSNEPGSKTSPLQYRWVGSE